MKKTVVAVTAVAVLAGGGYAAYDYSVPDSVTVVNAGGTLTNSELLPERAYGPYSPPVKKRFGRGKPSTPKKPIGRSADISSGIIFPAGRTNVHSDGRAGGKALPRRGEPRRHPSIGPGSLHKVVFELPMGLEVVG